MKKNLSLLFLLILIFSSAQTELVFVYFKDKPDAAAFLQNPRTELSDKALKRRTDLNIPLTTQDAPIHTPYVDRIKALGFTVTDHSKWLNGVAVNATRDEITMLYQQDFVKNVESFVKLKVSRTILKKAGVDKFGRTEFSENFDYGSALPQIEQINLKTLHDQNLTGKGISIAVIDTGFPTVNTGEVYARLRANGQIKGGYNFIHKNSDIYNPALNSHGSICLGIIGGFVEHQYAGSAPDADFYLYATEDDTREVPEEELYWIQAAEEADRQGVDVISSSLGYYEFDDPRYNYTYAQMDGKTTFISRAAQIAAEKGILVFSAAGNEGLNAWKYIIAPADNEKVFSVGGVDFSGNPSSFTSYGPNSAGAVKPDAAARGTDVAIVYNNSIGKGSGTSYATPLAAGGTASLLQGISSKVPREDVRQQLRENASLHPQHSNRIGFGILNFGETLSRLYFHGVNREKVSFFPNPVQDVLYIFSPSEVLSVEVYDLSGRLLRTFSPALGYDVSFLSKGIYLVTVTTRNGKVSEKIVKK